MLEHGGRLNAAVAHYGIAPARWLDLSTGINPRGWRVPALSARIWNRLPEPDDGLIAAAQVYYNAPQVLPVAGSQAAIQALPLLRAPCRVAVLHPGYAEHAHAWRHAGHTVTFATVEDVHAVVDDVDVLVLIHPNNPSGTRFATGQLLAWHERLAARGGWLVVDEAFMDTTPEASLAPFCGRPGMIVLRSLGKFFGLAGARAGFVLASQPILDALSEHLGPWTITGPTRWVATLALDDRAWQDTMRAQLLSETRRLAQLLAHYGLAPDGGTALFQWTRTQHAAAIHEHLAHLGILTRRFDEPPGIRFGLPGSEAQWLRLETALAGVVT